MTPATAAPHAPSHITVTVSYNGLTHDFTVTPHQTVTSLLELALNQFGIQANRHTQSLYNVAGAELPDVQSLEAAGITNGAQLLLRPSQVKGGLR